MRTYDYKNALNLEIQLHDAEKVISLWERYSGHGEGKFFEEVGYELEEMIEDGELSGEYAIQHYDRADLSENSLIFDYETEGEGTSRTVTLRLKSNADGLTPTHSQI